MKTNRFTPLQKKWLEELESGKHQQTQRTLCRMENGKPSYCCLGVAAEHVLHLKQKPPKHGDKVLFKSPTGRWYDLVLPPGSGEMLHLYSEEGYILYHNRAKFYAAIPVKKGDLSVHEKDSLAQYNDSYRCSFKQIAQAIRKVPWAVFTNFSKPTKKGKTKCTAKR